jgi:acyl-coenzyme A synthetase/AMP-(fatty) acid ligase
MGLYDFTIYDLICRNAVSFRDKPAWFEVDDGRTITFGQYKQKIDGLARGLRKDGIHKGDRIGVLGPRWALSCSLSTGGCQPMRLPSI